MNPGPQNGWDSYCRGNSQGFADTGIGSSGQPRGEWNLVVTPLTTNECQGK
jgi:hypothetical protein